MREDTVRVLRILEYVGPRKAIEEIVARSIQGTKYLDSGIYAGCQVKAATIGAYPEILAHAMPPIPF